MHNIMLRLLPGVWGFVRWLASVVISAVLAAVVVVALGYVVLTTANPVKEEIQAQAARYAREQFRSWLFGAAPQPDP